MKSIRTSKKKKSAKEKASYQGKDFTAQIIETIPSGIVVVDSKGNITFANRQAEKILGLTKDTISQRMYNDPQWRITDFQGNPFPEDKLPFQQVMSTGQPVYNVRHAIEHPSGKRVLLSMNASPLFNTSHQVDGMITTIENITDIIKAEELLYQSEEKFRSLAENMSDWIWEVDIDGRYTYSNPKVRDILGYEMEEILGKTPFDFIVPDDAIRIAEQFKRAIALGQPFSGLENINLHKDGHHVVLETSGTPVLNSDGKIIGYHGVDRDITERKKTSDALERANRQLAATINTLPDLLFEVDRDGRILSYHAPDTSKLYAPPELFLGKIMVDVIPKDAGDVIQRALNEAFETGHHFGATYSLNIPTGIHWFELSISRAGEFQSQDIRCIALVRDITDRIKAMEALRGSEERFRSIYENSTIGIYRTTPEGKIVLANPALVKMLGYSSFKELSLRNLEKEGFEPTYSRKQFIELIEKDGEIKGLESAWIRSDGTSMYVRENARAIRDKAGTILYYDGTVEDITVRKRAEESLRESEERTRAIIDHAPFGAHSYELQPDGRLLFMSANKSADRILGFDHSTVIGKSIEEAFPGLASTTVPEMYRRVAATGESRSIDQVDYDEGKIQGAFEVHAFQTVTNRMTVFFRDIAERKRAEEAVQSSAREWQTTFDAVNDAVWLLDPHQRIKRSNKAAEVMFHKTSDQLLGCHCCEVVHGTTEPIPECPYSRMKMTMQREMMELLVGQRWLNVTVDPVLDQMGNLVGAVHTVHDITERKRAEQEKEILQDQLLQSQKMDAIGQLAGGVAHDFNNMIGVILGYASMIEKKMNPADSSHQKIRAIITAAERSANLTKQLLAFARKQVANPLPLNLNDEIVELQKMLGHLIGEDIVLKIILAENLWNTKIDPTQITQILTNLATNARDAIENIGTITIETANSVIDTSTTKEYSEIAPGEYVTLMFSDSGKGIEKDTLTRIFEPFFTTKPKGAGTGLGLSTVFGIVKQNNGYINAYSEPGHGTTFKIYLSRHYGEVETPAEEIADIPLNGTETILIVEDEEDLLHLACTALEVYGYSILIAKSPAEALTLCNLHGKKIDLLVTDVIMPGMNGKELKERMDILYPQIKTLFMSGYTGEIVANRGILDEGTHFISKPFTPLLLARKVRLLLNG